MSWSKLILVFIGCLVTWCDTTDIWPLERPDGMTSIQSLEVMCGKDHMDVHLAFTKPFEGLVFSKGQYGHPHCVYVHPSSGLAFFTFRISYTKCGTKPDLHGQFYENTIVIQYDKDLLEVWDEAKRLRCEWFNDYEKTATKPPMVIADLDVIQLDFRGDNVDCWMEIQHGKGPWAPPVSGIVPLGSTLTLVIAINDHRGEFDMRVKSCAATDGGGHIIQLSDEHGCVLRPKMISKFLKARSSDERASVITYAFFHAFKFPDALSVHINCKVEICRRGCLEHCQLPGHGGGGGGGGAGHFLLDNYNPFPQHDYGPLERQDNGPLSSEEHLEDRSPANNNNEEEYDDDEYQNDESSSAVHFKEPTEVHYKEPVSVHYKEPPTVNFEDPTGYSKETNNSPPGLTTPAPTTNFHQNQPPISYYEDDSNEDIDKAATVELPRPFEEPTQYAALHQQRPGHRDGQLPLKSNKPRFPQGPRNLDLPLTFHGRKKRFVVSDNKARNADVGVSSLYEVISEADLAFTPDAKAESVTIFQGRIREDIVYGICLPAPGFSLIFVLVSMATVISALVAGFLFYHYQIQKEVQQGALLASVRNWMVLHVLRNHSEEQDSPEQQQQG